MYLTFGTDHLQVGVLSTTLDKIRVQFTNNPDGCLSEVLKQRLKAIDPELTWEIIVAALRTKIVGERRLAEEIEKKYCSSSVTGEQLDEGMKQTLQMIGGNIVFYL